MSWLSRLFGGKSAGTETSTKGQPEDHKGFAVTPEPIREGSQYRIAAKIEKTVDGTLRTHQLIRADTMGSYDEAVNLSLNKAKQVIDEQGERLFG